MLHAHDPRIPLGILPDVHLPEDAEQRQPQNAQDALVQEQREVDDGPGAKRERVLQDEEQQEEDHGRQSRQDRENHGVDPLRVRVGLLLQGEVDVFAVEADDGEGHDKLDEAEAGLGEKHGGGSDARAGAAVREGGGGGHSVAVVEASVGKGLVWVCGVLLVFALLVLLIIVLCVSVLLGLGGAELEEFEDDEEHRIFLLL